MKRRQFIAGLGAAATWPVVARAQQTESVSRIGLLSLGWRDRGFGRRNLHVFRQELQGFGYVEGRNIIIEYRFADGDFGRLPQLAAELVSAKVDVIIASPTAEAVAAKKTTDAIPIVMINVGDPVGLGLIASLARPGGNVTGLAFSVGLETLGKGLEILTDIIPNLHRVAILTNPANPSHALAGRHVEVMPPQEGYSFSCWKSEVPPTSTAPLRPDQKRRGCRDDRSRRPIRYKCKAACRTGREFRASIYARV